MAAVTDSPITGPVPRGIRIAFLVLTLGATAFAVAAAVRGVWLLTIVCGLFAVLNVGVLWTTRTPSGSGSH